MRKQTWVFGILLVLFCFLFVKVQSLIVDDRINKRVEEKILMLSDRPEVTKILSLGNESTLADLLWIRSIQYFGGNFSSLNKPDKKPGMINLFRNMVALDPKFGAAYQFGGFVMNESIKDSNMAVSFLLEGANQNPDIWRLRFDAGFIAFYQLQDYDTAKKLFIQTVYGEDYVLNADLTVQGLVEGFNQKAIQDDDTQDEVKFHPDAGVIDIDLKQSFPIGHIHLTTNLPEPQSYRFSFSNEAEPASASAYHIIPDITECGFYDLVKPFSARHIRIDEMKSSTEDGFFSISEVQLNGTRNPEVPSYVDRMIFEMDRAAGRFRVAWDQYLRYYAEAKEKGDEISATLAVDKLNDIYLNKIKEILDETIRVYLEKEGKLPSPSMKELVEGGYLQQVLQTKIQEEDQFRIDVLPVLVGPNQNIYNILVNWDGSTPIIMIPITGSSNKMDWIITPRSALVEQQRVSMESIQKLVDQFKEETGKLPQQLEDLKKNRMFTAKDELFQDPLGGEYQINQQTGEVEAVNPLY